MCRPVRACTSFLVSAAADQSADRVRSSRHRALSRAVRRHVVDALHLGSRYPSRVRRRFARAHGAPVAVALGEGNRCLQPELLVRPRRRRAGRRLPMRHSCAKRPDAAGFVALADGVRLDRRIAARPAAGAGTGSDRAVLQYQWRGSLCTEAPATAADGAGRRGRGGRPQRDGHGHAGRRASQLPRRSGRSTTCATGWSRRAPM